MSDGAWNGRASVFGPGVPQEPMDLELNTINQSINGGHHIDAPYDDTIEQDDDEMNEELEPSFDGINNANLTHDDNTEVTPPAATAFTADYDVADVTLGVSKLAHAHIVCADLEQFSTQFTSRALLQRLAFIVDHCVALKADALFLMIKYIQVGVRASLSCRLALQENTYDVEMYKECMQKLNIGGDAPLLDQNWVGRQIDQEMFIYVQIETTMKRGATKSEKLEQDLKHYKANSIKDSIRRGYYDFAEHCVELGDLAEALRNFSRARLLESMQPTPTAAAGSSASAAGGGTALSKDQQTFMNTMRSQLRAVSGLADLAAGRYQQAAGSFLKVIFDHLNYAAIISAREVGVYAALCALATYDRQQLAAVVINNPPFKQFLELEPRLLNALRLFNAGDYERCLTVLEELRPTLLLDMHLAKHVATLYEHIRKRGLVAYCLPYSCADLTVMARAFNTGVEELQTELFQLIVDKKMHARIDSENKQLHATVVDERQRAYERALASACAVQQTANFVAVRAAMHRHKICVRVPRKSDQQQQKQPLTNASKSRVQSAISAGGAAGGKTVKKLLGLGTKPPTAGKTGNQAANAGASGSSNTGDMVNDPVPGESSMNRQMDESAMNGGESMPSARLTAGADDVLIDDPTMSSLSHTQFDEEDDEQEEDDIDETGAVADESDDSQSSPPQPPI